MKIALYIEEGVEQVVLTPKTDTEKNILNKLHDGSRQFSLKKGSFYQCQGGWVRKDFDDESTMIVLRPVVADPSVEDIQPVPAIDREELLNILAVRFCATPLPANMAADPCVIDSSYPHLRSGTNLLSAVEAREVLMQVLEGYTVTENAS